MFDFAWSELMLIGAVALIAIGPKDLPKVMRTVGFWVRQARSVAREFQSSLEQLAREAELDEVRKQVDKATGFDIDAEFNRTIDPRGELRSTLSDPLAEPPKPPPAPEQAAPRADGRAPDAAAAIASPSRAPSLPPQGEGRGTAQ